MVPEEEAVAQGAEAVQGAAACGWTMARRIDPKVEDQIRTGMADQVFAKILHDSRPGGPAVHDDGAAVGERGMADESKKTKEAKEPQTKKGYLIYLTPDKGANQVIKASGEKAGKDDHPSREWCWHRTNREGHGGHLFKSKTEAAKVAAWVGGDVREVTMPVKGMDSTIQK